MRLTLARLKSILHYDPDTGVWTWLDTRHNAVAVGSKAGSLKSDKYIKVKIDGQTYSSSRLAFFYMTGNWPMNEMDHVNRNPSDNRWYNLREADRTQNNTNKNKYKTNTSGVKGVHWRKQSNKWHAQIQVEGKKIHLGLFDDLNLAIDTRRKAEKLYHKDFTNV